MWPGRRLLIHPGGSPVEVARQDLVAPSCFFTYLHGESALNELPSGTFAPMGRFRRNLSQFALLLVLPVSGVAKGVDERDLWIPFNVAAFQTCMESGINGHQPWADTCVAGVILREIGPCPSDAE